jgi:hypothetical protein
LATQKIQQLIDEKIQDIAKQCQIALDPAVLSREIKGNSVKLCWE